MQGIPRMTLASLSDGACEELFQEKLAEIKANIANDEVSATAVRKIIIEIKFAPSQNRTEIVTAVSASVKMPEPDKSMMGIMYLANDDGELVATAKNPKQLDLADQLRAAKEKQA